jgi:DNA polymerase-1
VRQLAAEAGAAGAPQGRVRCSWNQSATATGRLSSSSPNLQAVTKYTVQAFYQPTQAPPGEAAAGGCIAEINIRDAFTAPPGHVLLAADYSQMELRILAHLSG